MENSANVLLEESQWAKIREALVAFCHEKDCFSCVMANGSEPCSLCELLRQIPNIQTIKELTKRITTDKYGAR